MVAGTMPKTTHRISVASMLVFVLGTPGHDAEAGKFVASIMRAAATPGRHTRLHAIAIVRKAVVVETVGEPHPEFLADLQRLADEFEIATTAPDHKPGDFDPRVEVAVLAETVAVEMTSAAIDQPGSAVERQVSGGRLRIVFEPGNATATAERLPGDDIADPTPMFARDEATGEWVESDRDPAVV
jgi:hypothetical protein